MLILAKLQNPPHMLEMSLLLPPSLQWKMVMSTMSHLALKPPLGPLWLPMVSLVIRFAVVLLLLVAFNLSLVIRDSNMFISLDLGVCPTPRRVVVLVDLVSITGVFLMCAFLHILLLACLCTYSTSLLSLVCSKEQRFQSCLTLILWILSTLPILLTPLPPWTLA